LEQPEVNIQASHAWLKKSNIHPETEGFIQSDQQETKSRVLPHLLFYRNVFLSWISRFYLLAVDTRFVGCLPLKNLSLIAFINFL
jgi:hypothetical protein